LKALIDSYLDIEHCEDVAGGCPVAALATEIARHPAKARAAFLRVLKNHVARLAKYIPSTTEEGRERKARVLFSGMAGRIKSIDVEGARAMPGVRAVFTGKDVAQKLSP
jgi:TetR/AcrR family transcriptional repressor of nem operon